jgi:hypothetical protein
MERGNDEMHLLVAISQCKKPISLAYTLLIKEWYVKFHLSSKVGYFEWSLVPVDTHNGEFFPKLVHMCDEDNLPILVGRDFHIIR